MSEYGDLINEDLGSAQRSVVGNADAEPDKAARALELEDATGVPAAAIHGDVEGFEKQHKAALTSQLVAENHYLQDYINSGPMNAKVSADDWHNLDEVSGHLNRLNIPSWRYSRGDVPGSTGGDSVLGTAVKGAYTSLTEAPYGEMTRKRIADHPTTEVWAKLFPSVESLVETGELGVETFQRLFGAAMEGLGAGAEEATKQLGGDEQAAYRARRNISGMVEAWMFDIGAHGPHVTPEAAGQIKGRQTVQRTPEALAQIGKAVEDLKAAYTAAKPYVDAGKEPPPGTHPLIDKLHEEQAKRDVQALDDAYKATQASATQARHPPTMAGFVRQHTEGTIAISADAVRRIYGDAEPALEDSKLGWVPDIVSQLRTAEASGGYVEVPIADWLTKASPEVAKELHDDIRVRPNGVTISEAKELKTEGPKAQAQEEEPASPAVQAIRQSAKLDPIIDKIPEDVQVGPGTRATMLPSEELTAKQHDIINAVNKVMERIVPRLVDVHAVKGITLEDRPVKGLYQQFSDKMPLILYAIDSEDAVGTGRHEAIHHLRQQGFFSKDEWNTLRAAAMDEKWIQKHDIQKRYKGMGLGGQLEEAIAEEFKAWRRAEYDQATGKLKEGPPHVAGRIFEKLHQLLQGIKTALREALGYEPNVEDLFHKVETGEVGSRRPVEPLHPGAFKHPLAEELPEAERKLFEKGSALGVSQKTLKNLLRLIQERNAGDVEAQTKAASRDIKRRQGKEWKENEAKVLQEVSEDIRSRPDIASDAFFRDGTLPGGEKLENKPRLDADKLTAEQKAELHPHTYGKDGLAPDDAAGMFGYQSGEAMINRMRMLEQARRTEGKGPAEYLGKLIGDETERRMQERYGDLNENILEEAKDHVISPTEMDKLHEEYMMVGQMVHGEDFQAPFKKEDVKSFARQTVDADAISKTSTDKYLRVVGKAGQKAIDELAAGNPTEALKALQQRNVAMALANEAKKQEKARKQFDKNAESLRPRSKKGYDQEYMNFIHQILGQVGKRVNRSIQDLQTEIAKGANKNLEDFYWDKKEGELLNIPIPEFLFDKAPGWKKTEDLTGAEFTAVHQAITTMRKLARDAQRINDMGEKKDLNEALNDKILPQMTRLPEQIRSMKERGIKAGAVKWIKVFWAAHLGWETIANRMALDDPLGAWNRMLVYPLADAPLYKQKLVNHFEKVLKRIPLPEDRFKLIEDHPFKDFHSRTDDKDAFSATRKMAGFTKDDWLGALQVAGDKGGRDKMFRGWGIKEEEFWPALWRNVTEEDFNRAQKIGYIFEHIKKLTELRDRELFGISPERVPIDKIQTPWGDKDGWYHHVKYRADWSGTSQKLLGKDVLEQEGFTSASAPKSWEKQRSGYAAPVDVSLNHVPMLIEQMLHDLAFREPIIQTQKFFRNQKFQNTMIKHFGLEYKEQLMPYLKALTNQSNFNSAAQTGLFKLVSFLRSNVIGNVIGLNPSTVLKHGPTAAFMSMKEVGIKNWSKEFVSLLAKDPETGESNWKWAANKFGELQLRHQNAKNIIYGAGENIAPPDSKIAKGYMSIRDGVQSIGSTPVAFSDLASATPTAIAAYEKVMREGVDHPDVGKLAGLDEDPAPSPADFKKLDTIATTLANRAVRRAHGSTAITNKAAVLRGDPMAQQFTSIYNFFSDILQRRYELAWKTVEAKRSVKEGDFEKGRDSFVKDVLPGVLAYVILPGVIEEWVTSRYDEEEGRKRGFGERFVTMLAKGALHTVVGSFVGLRDLAYGLQPGHETQMGILGNILKTQDKFKEDMFKGHAFDKANLGRTFEHTNSLLGGLTGLTNAHIGKFGHAMYDYSKGYAHPKTGKEWMKLFETGTMERRR